MIFDYFSLDKDIPIIQYKSLLTSVVSKVYIPAIKEIHDFQNKDLLNPRHGLTFKIFLNNYQNFIIVNIYNGVISYRSQWSIRDKTTLDDIKKQFNILDNLLNRINKTPIIYKISKKDLEENYNFILINSITTIKFEKKILILIIIYYQIIVDYIKIILI